jgi:trimethylamine--corrinoid protein Co-methyltransferase
MAGYVQRILKGICVIQDKLALDTIIEVGPGGTYLEHDHTLKYFRAALSENNRQEYPPGM